MLREWAGKGLCKSILKRAARHIHNTHTHKRAQTCSRTAALHHPALSLCRSATRELALRSCVCVFFRQNYTQIFWGHQGGTSAAGRSFSHRLIIAIFYSNFLRSANICLCLARSCAVRPSAELYLTEPSLPEHCRHISYPLDHPLQQRVGVAHGYISLFQCAVPAQQVAFLIGVVLIVIIIVINLLLF